MRLSRLLQVIGLALFVAVIFNAGPQKVAASFLSMNPLYLLISMAMTFIVMFLRGIKWMMVSRLHGVRSGVLESTKVWVIGLFAGIITPGRAGDMIRSLYLSRKGCSLGKSVSAVVVDRAVDLAIVLAFAVLGAVFFTSLLLSPSYVWILAVVTIAFASLAYAASRKGTMKRILRPMFRMFVSKRYKDHVSSGFNGFYGSISSAIADRWGLARIVLFTVFIWLFSIWNVQIMALAVGLKLDYPFLLAMMSLAVIIEIIPVSVSGVGTRDAFFVLALGIVGVSPETAIGFSIIYMVLGYWVNGLIGLMFWLRDPVNIRA
jgi:hypothetical protein